MIEWREKPKCKDCLLGHDSNCKGGRKGNSFILDWMK